MDVSVMTLTQTDIYFKKTNNYNISLHIKKFFLALALVYLNKRYNFAHGLAEPPVASDVGDHRRRQTNENDEEITDGQVNNEYIRDCSHVSILDNDNDDEQIANDANDKYGKCEYE